VAAAVPGLFRVRADQPQAGFVDQGGGVEGLARLLLGQLPCGQPAQRVVDQGQKPAGRLRIARIDGAQGCGSPRS
jgi:hypothetical protein